MPGIWLIRFGQGGTLRCAAASALLIAGVLLASCSTNVGDARAPGTDPPSALMPYPGVHDMPPPRSNTTLNDTERLRAQQDLINARDAVANRAQQKMPKRQPEAADASSKKPVKTNRPTTQAPGSDRNP
jgi:hypothetical protein